MEDYTMYAIIGGEVVAVAMLVALAMQELCYQKLLTYKKVGGLHFVTMFRLGFSFYIKRAN